MREFHSPYMGMGNNPVNLTDPTGGCTGDCPEPVYSQATLQEIVITPANGISFDSEHQEYAFGGTFEQWQNKFGHPGLTYDQEMFIYDLFHRDEFFKQWDASVKYERGQIAVAKMKFFIEGTTTAGAIGMGAFGSALGSSASPKQFNLSPRGYNSSAAKNLHMGAQGKHIPSAHNFQSGKSILNADPKVLLEMYHSGRLGTLRTIGSNKVLVNFRTNIGTYYQNGSPVGATRFGMIHSGKHGAHIIPANPVQY